VIGVGRGSNWCTTNRGRRLTVSFDVCCAHSVGGVLAGGRSDRTEIDVPTGGDPANRNPAVQGLPNLRGLEVSADSGSLRSPENVGYEHGERICFSCHEPAKNFVFTRYAP
jgi:hypothetical protein